MHIPRPYKSKEDGLHKPDCESCMSKKSYYRLSKNNIGSCNVSLPPPS